jgi:DNA-binding NarL/FixJ family response regulator
MQSDKVRVLIADDHRLVSLGLRMVLERAGMEVVGEAATGRLAVEMAEKFGPDVVLLDILMPDMDGLQALGAMRSSVPRASIIIITAYARPDFLARAVAMGAAGYITKDEDPAKIPVAVRAVVDGEAIVNRELLEMALRELSETAKAHVGSPHHEAPPLTPQQKRVLTLIAEGLDNDTIAQTLSVSKNTVKTHVREIFQKLGVTDRTQAAVWALRNGFLS